MHSAHSTVRRLALLALSLLLPLAGWADEDPPGRVGRFADLQGQVSIYDRVQGQWVPARRNLPLTQGDRLATEADARAELRVGSTTLRLGADSDLEVLRLDDAQLRLELHSGSLALRLRSPEVAAETDVVTDEARLQPTGSGQYRIDRSERGTDASSWRGALRVIDDDGRDEAFVTDNGRGVELWREGPDNGLHHAWTDAPDDAFAAWVLREDRHDDIGASGRYVSPEMTGAEDLDRNGRWEQDPEVGPVWVPLQVQADWAPYRYGHWAWVAPWGWSWVDDAPWGFAPFHYGRWVHWGGRWCWSPGRYVARPVYAPALVAWIGGPQIGISIGIGGALPPAVGWVPLAPHEVFVPYYRTSPGYRDRVNHRPPGRGRPPVQVPTGPVMYGNQGVPGAVTVVPRDVLVHREPVANAVIGGREPLPRGRPLAPVTVLPAPAGPVHGVPRDRPVPLPPGARVPPPRVMPVPGGAVPVPPPGEQRRPPVTGDGQRPWRGQQQFQERPQDRPQERAGDRGPGRGQDRMQDRSQDKPREAPRETPHAAAPDRPQGGPPQHPPQPRRDLPQLRHGETPPEVVDLRRQPLPVRPPAPRPAPPAAVQPAPPAAVERAPQPPRGDPGGRGERDDPRARPPESRGNQREQLR